MFILSFDVGIKNLAYSYLDLNDTSIKILKWDVKQIPTEIVKLVSYLNILFEEIIQHINVVVVEKQPGRNSKMKIIETILMTYFILKGVPKVVSYSAKHKLGVSGHKLKGKRNYKERKKLSIRHCECVLLNLHLNEIDMFKNSKKKDDLADCFLQALAFMNHESLKNIDIYSNENIEKEKIIARKPTDKQIRFGYSKSNLKYFLRNMSEEDFKKDVQILKAIDKLFGGDMCECLNSI